MDEDEVLVCVAAVVIGGRYWFLWLQRAGGLFAPQCPLFRRCFTLALPPLLLGLLTVVIARVADQEVRENPGYIVLFTAVGGVSLAIATAFAAVIGIDALRDGVERANVAASVAVAGLWLGTLALNIGANIGEGATIYTTLLPLGLGLIEWLSALLLVAGVSGLAAAISEQRSLAAGLRFGSLALAVALPIAKAASGDWAGAAGTAADLGWAGLKVLCLLAAGGLVERGLRNRGGGAPRPLVACGLLPALAYLAGAALLTGRLSHGRP